MAKLQIFLPDGSQTGHELAEEKITIGRLADNGLQIDIDSVSSHHAEITFENGAHHLHDLNSTNGTYVNGEQIQDAILKHGDEVSFGAIECVFQSEVTPDQPLPEMLDTAVQAAHASKRPLNFVSSSPIPKNVKKRDLVAFALFGVVALGGVAFFVSARLVLGMVIPD